MLLQGANAFENYWNFRHSKPKHGSEPQKNGMIQQGVDYFKNGWMWGVQSISNHKEASFTDEKTTCWKDQS
jgi:hypothetical protein